MELRHHQITDHLGHALDHQEASGQVDGQETLFPDEVLQRPFLSIEFDSNPFPQIVDTRVEAFCLQVERLHKSIKDKGAIAH